MNTSSILGIWGAIVSTIALTWNIIRGLQDKRKLQVEANVGVVVPGDTDKKYFYVVITNVGRRPILVISYGASLKKKPGEKGKPGLIAIARNLPKMLKEGEYVLEYTEDMRLLSKKTEDIIVTDSTGKKWKADKKYIKQYLEQ